MINNKKSIMAATTIFFYFVSDTYWSEPSSEYLLSLNIKAKQSSIHITVTLTVWSFLSYVGVENHFSI